MKHTIPIVFAAAATLYATDAMAHIQLRSPPQRTTSLKSGPCGAPSGTRGTNITTYSPGQTITLEWDETVNHPSHYRISFDADGQDDFVDPNDFMDFYSGPSVLIDEITDGDGGSHTQEVTLPDIECDNCTIQIIQVMYDKPPYGDGNDIYYQCADVVLAGGGPVQDPDAGIGDPAPDPDPAPTPSGGVSGGCDAGHPGSTPALILLVIAGLVARRRFV